MDSNAFREQVRSANAELFSRIGARRQRLSSVETVASKFFTDDCVKGLIEDALSLANDVGNSELFEVDEPRFFERAAEIVLATTDRKWPCRLRVAYVADPNGRDGFEIVVSVRFGEIQSAAFQEGHGFPFGSMIKADILPWFDRTMREAVPKFLETAISPEL